MIYEQFLEQFTDWRPKTLYWQNFSIAEKFGNEEILSVYDKIFNEAKEDYELLTELSMILNHKCWEYSEYVDDPGLCTLYSDLYYSTRNYALEHLVGEELSYFLDITD